LSSSRRQEEEGAARRYREKIKGHTGGMVISYVRMGGYNCSKNYEEKEYDGDLGTGYPNR